MYANKHILENKLCRSMARHLFTSGPTWTLINRARVLHACGVPWLICVAVIDGLEVEDIPLGNLLSLELIK
jgi:hypothetical protein